MMEKEVVGKKFLQIFLPYADIQEQAVCCERSKRVLGALVHDYEISGGHIDRGVVDFVDQCAAVYIIQLKIVMAVFRIGLIYIVCDQKDISALGKFAENVMEVFYVQDIAGKVLYISGQFIRSDCLGSMAGAGG